MTNPTNCRYGSNGTFLEVENSEINLRPASIEALAILRYWDEQPHVIASDPNSDWEWKTELLRNPNWREQFIAELDGEPIGFVQVIDPAREDNHYWSDVPLNLRAVDIWIGEARFLGKGYGTHIMKLVLDRCFGNSDVTAILIDPLEGNTRAHRFYESLGFKILENRLFGDDACCVYRLKREDYKTRKDQVI